MVLMLFSEISPLLFSPLLLAKDRIKNETPLQHPIKF
jgi:hypothetical protein